MTGVISKRWKLHWVTQMLLVVENTDYLAEIHRYKNKPGLKLISKERDPSNLRRYQLVLTKSGKQLVDTLKEQLYG